MHLFHQKRLKVAVVVFVSYLAITIASSYFCFTGNWLGVGYGHMMLSVTERNMQQVLANMFLVKDFDIVVEQFENEGWDILERRSDGYRLQKSDIYWLAHIYRIRNHQKQLSGESGKELQIAS